MKYYLAFIMLSDKDKSDIKGFSSIQNPFIWEYDRESSTWFALYAWTTEKKIMKKFKKERSEKYFRYKTIEDDLNEKEQYWQEFSLQVGSNSWFLICFTISLNFSTTSFNSSCVKLIE